MIEVRDRPDVLRGYTYSTDFTCGGEPIGVTINVDEKGQPFEVFFQTSHSGECLNVMTDSLAIAISLGLRAGIPLKEYVESYQYTRCPRQVTAAMNKGHAVLSCVDAIAQIFKRFLEDKDNLQTPPLEGFDMKKAMPPVDPDEDDDDDIPDPRGRKPRPDSDFPDDDDDGDDDDEEALPNCPPCKAQGVRFKMKDTGAGMLRCMRCGFQHPAAQFQGEAKKVIPDNN